MSDPRKLDLQINFEKKAEKFFNKNNLSRDEIVELIIKAVKKLSGYSENIDMKHLKGEFQGYLRIRKNDLRIIIKIIEEDNQIIVSVVNIDFRGSIYK
jgi:mRNA-degrading endonuclease RelE of RelBE toxin-antitoxin system